MDVPQISEDEMAEIKKDVSTSNRRSDLDSDSNLGVRKVKSAEGTDAFHTLPTPFGLLFGDQGRFQTTNFSWSFSTTGFNRAQFLCFYQDKSRMFVAHWYTDMVSVPTAT